MKPKPRLPLDLNRLNLFQELTFEAGEANWQALGVLVDHLDDPLVRVWSIDAFEGGPCMMAVFRIQRDQGREQASQPIDMYVLVTFSGKVVLGSLDPKEQLVSRYLDDFDPVWHQLVSVTVQERYTSNRFDLWIVVYRSPHSGEKTSKVVAFHGILGYEEEPFISPSLDDWGQETRTWRASSPSKLPKWLREWNYCGDIGLNPFNHPVPEEWAHDFRSSKNTANLTLDFVFRAQNFLLYSFADDISIRPFPKEGEGNTVKTIYARERVRCGSLWEEASNKAFGVVGCDDRRLITFNFENGELSQKETHFCHVVPTAMAFLPPESELIGNRDLLTAFLDGTLSRVRFLRKAEIDTLWLKLWDNVALNSSAERIVHFENTRGKMPEEQRKALLVGIAQQFLQETAEVPTDPRDARLSRFISAFSQSESRRVLTAGIQVLTKALREELIHPAPVPKLSAKGRLIIEILHRFYNRHGNMVLIDHIDRFFSSITVNDGLLQDNKVKFLYDGSHRSRNQIVEEPLPKDIQELGYYGNFGIERWANAYWPACQIQMDLSQTPGLARLSLPVAQDSKKMGHYLLIAGKNRLRIIPVSNYGQLLSEQETVCDINLENDSLRKVIGLPGVSGAAFLVAGSSGDLYLYACQPEHQKVILLDHLPMDHIGVPRTLSVCEGTVGEVLVAIAYTRPRTSTIALVKVSGGTLALMGKRRPDLPLVSHIDLSRSDPSKSLLFMEVSAHGSPVQFLDTDLLGEVSRKKWFGELKTGALAVRFDDPQKPRFALAAERDGLLWCADLDQEDQSTALAWTYKLKGSVRGLETVCFNHERHFLIGTETGELTLLRARDGCRVWKHDLGAPILQILDVGGNGDFVAVLAQLGQIFMYTRNDGERGTLEKAREYMARIGSSSMAELAESWPNAPSFQAIIELERASSDCLSILKCYSDRETRARILRYLILETKLCGEAFTALLRELSFRELILAQSYLPSGQHECEDLVWQEILGRSLPQVSSGGDNSSHAAMAAVATYLQRFAGRRPSLAQIQDLAINKTYFKHEWVRIEFSRLLLQATERELRADPKSLNQTIFTKVLPLLVSHYTPDLLIACARVLPYKSAARAPFEILTAIISSLTGVTELLPRSVETLANYLSPLSLRTDSFPLIWAITKAFACFQENHRLEGIPWPDWRVDQLESLRLVQRQLGLIKNSPPPFDDLVANLSTILPIVPLPDDPSELNQRYDWFERVQRVLRSHAGSESRGESIHFWRHVAQALFEKFKTLVQEIANFETDHILKLVRPRLTQLGKAHLADSHKLSMRFSAEPEGYRELHDVTITIDAGYEGGLLRITKSPEPINFSTYPGKFSRFDFHLEGFVHPNKKKIQVVTKVTDGDGYCQIDYWPFELPTPPSREVGRYTLPTHLPLAYEHFLNEVVRSKGPVVLAVLDADLGRNRFAADWCQRTGGLHLDLDGELNRFGQGRDYSARSLDVDLIEEKVAALAPPSRDKPKRILLEPVDGLIQRLIDGEAPGVLQDWLKALDQRARGHAKPQIVLAVSSEHAHALNHLDLGSILEIAAHQRSSSLIQATGEQGHLAEEMAGLAQSEAELKSKPAHAHMSSLGWDFCLVFRWLRWFREQRTAQSRLNLNDFINLNTTQTLLLATLRSLKPFELLVAILGATTDTFLKTYEVIPGVFAAEDSFSRPGEFTGNIPKLLQAKGEPFSDASLQKISFVRPTPIQFKVQGLGLTGTCDPDRPRLLDLVMSRGKEYCRPLAEALAAKGMGSWVGDVWRTASPYRGLIRDLYRKHAYLKDEVRDSEVYQDILGTRRSPLDNFSLPELLKFPGQTLMGIMPHTAGTELELMHRLFSRLWAETPAPEEIRLGLVEIFAGETLRFLGSTHEPWESPLEKLPYPVFAIDSGSSEYVIWIDKETIPNLNIISNAVKDCEKLYAERQKKGEDNTPPDASMAAKRPLKPMLLGPGVLPTLSDPNRRISCLGDVDILQALWEGNLGDGIRRRARRQLRLTALSPFQTSGALPPGSPNFVGREEELDYIQGHIRGASILIVGSRRVGKTSLLNRIKFWADDQPDLVPVFVELQGVRNRREFQTRLSLALSAEDLPGDIQRSPDSDLQHIARKIKGQGKLLILLLNEIDGIVKDDPHFIEEWRGLNDQQLVRFLMVGYSAIDELENPRTPLFHFTQGKHFGGKAIALTSLSESAAENLLNLLTDSELQLRWEDENQRREALKLCVERSYRIPWVLQRFGEIFVERVEENFTDILTYNLVDRSLNTLGDVVWDYIESIDYNRLADGNKDNTLRPGLQLVLFAMARDRYFLGEQRAAIRDPELARLNPLHQNLGFSVGDAKKSVKQTMAQLLRGKERGPVELWFDGLDLSRTLRLLTLTLILEPDPEQKDRYGFLLHILPRELFRKYGKVDITLDDLIIKRAIEFMNIMKSQERPPNE